ncbi:MAG: hypothetical protein ACI81L_000804 [Verrucomicrobiales bacterium]|jgi:hypothetical protein
MGVVTPVKNLISNITPTGNTALARNIVLAGDIGDPVCVFHVKQAD